MRRAKPVTATKGADACYDGHRWCCDDGAATSMTASCDGTRMLQRREAVLGSVGGDGVTSAQRCGDRHDGGGGAATGSIGATKTTTGAATVVLGCYDDGRSVGLYARPVQRGEDGRRLR